MPITKLETDNREELSTLLSFAIEQDELDVPMLPTVASRVITLTQDPDSDAKQLSDLIQGDLALAAYVMRIANSPAYTPDGNLVSLQQAIARLGMRIIGEIAVTASVNSKTFKAKGFESQISQLWDHSLATALWSKEIARECRKNVECVFLCGLLHSIGKPAALQKTVDLANTNDLSLDTAIGLDLVSQYQRCVGIKVVQQWAMPQAVVDVISYFHDYQSSPNAIEPTAIVVAGSAFATSMSTPELMPEESLFELEASETINLYSDQIESLLEKFECIRTSMETMKS